MFFNDQTVATVTGLGVVVVLRVLDWLVPRGYVSKWTQKWSVRRDEQSSDQERVQRVESGSLDDE